MTTDGLDALWATLGEAVTTPAPRQRSARARLDALSASVAQQLSLLDENRVVTSWVPVTDIAWGSYVSVTGVGADWKPLTVTGYLVHDHPWRGGIGGAGADLVALYVADRPDTDMFNAVIVYAEPATTVTVLEPPPGMPPGTPAPFTRMPIEEQVTVAGHLLGLPVTVIPAEPNPIYQVADHPPTALSRIAEYLLDGGFARSLGRAHPVPHPNRTRRPS